MLSPCVTSYINTLNNPFEFPGQKLGFGTMVPTQLATGYIRGSFATNTDGSFAIFLQPGLNYTANSVIYNVSGVGGTTWNNGGTYSNAQAVSLLMQEARIVSAGIKVLPQVPATSPPGVIYAGSVASATYNQLTAATPMGLAVSPFLRVGYGATGASACAHPVDPVSYQFVPQMITGFGAASTYTSSTPVIVGIGFPVSTIVYFEAVVNLEGIGNYSNESQAIQNPEVRDESSTGKLSETFASIEQMWSTISSYVPTSATINEAATTMAPIVRGAASLYARSRNRGYGSARQQYYNFPNNSPSLSLMD
jgi:hypothetical protein